MELRQISLREIYTTTTVMWRIERCQNAGALVLRLKNKYIHFSYFYWFTLLFYFLFLSASGEAGNLCLSKTENSLLVITRLQELKLYQRLQSDNTVKPKELPQCRLRWSSAAEQSRWQAARVCLWSHALRTFLMLHFSQGGDDGLWSFALCSEAVYDFFLFFFFFSFGISCCKILQCLCGSPRCACRSSGCPLWLQHSYLSPQTCGIPLKLGRSVCQRDSSHLAHASEWREVLKAFPQGESSCCQKSQAGTSRCLLRQRILQGTQEPSALPRMEESCARLASLAV